MPLRGLQWHVQQYLTVKQPPDCDQTRTYFPNTQRAIELCFIRIFLYCFILRQSLVYTYYLHE